MTQAPSETNGRVETGVSGEDVARRLEELRSELRTGEERLRELDAERGRVRDTLLRIEGAILALQELGGTPPE